MQRQYRIEPMVLKCQNPELETQVNQFKLTNMPYNRTLKDGDSV